MAWRWLLTRVANQQSKHPYLIDLRGRSHSALHKGASGGANLKVPAPPDEIEMSIRHELWMAEHGRAYKDEFEKQVRFEIFKQNVEYIESFNKRGDHKYILGVNKSADMTHQEFKATHFGFNYDFVLNHSHATNTKAVHANLSDVPASKDWRAEGAVTAVEDQGACVSKQPVADGTEWSYRFRFYRDGVFTG